MLNDLWVLDVASMQWTELHPEGQLPHVRCSHTAVVMGTNIVIFGGSYYRYALMSCTFALDFVPGCALHSLLMDLKSCQALLNVCAVMALQAFG